LRDPWIHLRYDKDEFIRYWTSRGIHDFGGTAVAKGLDCVTCHPSNKEHNFAKGDALQETVRDDLDNTMHSCEDYHYKGKDKKAKAESTVNGTIVLVEKHPNDV
jgi:hypothetical protein